MSGTIPRAHNRCSARPNLPRQPARLSPESLRVPLSLGHQQEDTKYIGVSLPPDPRDLNTMKIQAAPPLPPLSRPPADPDAPAISNKPAPCGHRKPIRGNSARFAHREQ